MGKLWHKFATSCGTNIGYIAHKEPQKLCLFLLCLSVKTNFRHIVNFTEDFVYSVTILCCESVMGAKWGLVSEQCMEHIILHNFIHNYSCD